MAGNTFRVAGLVQLEAVAVVGVAVSRHGAAIRDSLCPRFTIYAVLKTFWRTPLAVSNMTAPCLPYSRGHIYSGYLHFAFILFYNSIHTYIYHIYIYIYTRTVLVYIAADQGFMKCVPGFDEKGNDLASQDKDKTSTRMQFPWKVQFLRTPPQKKS